MSTPSSRSQPAELGAPARVAGPSPADDPTEPTSADRLAVVASTFVGRFDRWSSRKAVEAGASIPRLRLLYEVHCNGPQKMADLADALAVTPRNVTALVDGLEADGLVRRQPHSTDRRVTMVELTCNSESVAAQFATYQSSIASLFLAMTEDERLTLLRLLEGLQARMHAEASYSTADAEAPIA
jgi:DNA-binding MarR family transcriptional regulator